MSNLLEIYTTLEHENAHVKLDELGIARAAPAGMVYSLLGRIELLYAAGVLAGRAEQQEADAKLCDEAATKAEASAAKFDRLDLPVSAEAMELQVLALQAAAADIRAANLPAPGAGEL